MEKLTTPSAFKLTGPSMQPYLHDGDTVLVDLASPTPPAAGAIVLLKAKDQYVAHRLLSNGKTKGDWLRSYDEFNGTFIGVAIGRVTAKKVLRIRHHVFEGALDTLARHSTHRGIFGYLCHGVFITLLWTLRKLENIQ